MDTWLQTAPRELKWGGGGGGHCLLSTDRIDNPVFSVTAGGRKHSVCVRACTPVLLSMGWGVGGELGVVVLE